jgi:hypothetical protein
MAFYNINRLTCVLAAVLLAIFGGAAVFFICSIALTFFAEAHYSHPGSMVWLWAFGESVPIGIVGAIIIFVFAPVKIKPLRKQQS